MFSYLLTPLFPQSGVPFPTAPVLPGSRAAPYPGAESRSEQSSGAWSEAAQH